MNFVTRIKALFGFHSLASIVSDFEKKYDQLHDHADKLTERGNKAHKKGLDLLWDAAEHDKQADRARRIASRIEALVD